MSSSSAAVLYKYVRPHKHDRYAAIKRLSLFRVIIRGYRRGESGCSASNRRDRTRAKDWESWQSRERSTRVYTWLWPYVVCHHLSLPLLRHLEPLLFINFPPHRATSPPRATIDILITFHPRSYITEFTVSTINYCLACTHLDICSILFSIHLFIQALIVDTFLYQNNSWLDWA